MAQKIYNIQIPSYLNPQIAEQAFRRNEDDYCFLIF